MNSSWYGLLVDSKAQSAVSVNRRGVTIENPQTKNNWQSQVCGISIVTLSPADETSLIEKKSGTLFRQ
jgi:hypothetical protein